jgi:hypothetical protein
MQAHPNEGPSLWASSVTGNLHGHKRRLRGGVYSRPHAPDPGGRSLSYPTVRGASTPMTFATAHGL